MNLNDPVPPQLSSQCQCELLLSIFYYKIVSVEQCQDKTYLRYGSSP
jgi:hypothetical protein